MIFDGSYKETLLCGRLMEVVQVRVHWWEK